MRSAPAAVRSSKSPFYLITFLCFLSNIHAFAVQNVPAQKSITTYSELLSFETRSSVRNRSFCSDFCNVPSQLLGYPHLCTAPGLPIFGKELLTTVARPGSLDGVPSLALHSTLSSELSHVKHSLEKWIAVSDANSRERGMYGKDHSCTP